MTDPRLARLTVVGYAEGFQPGDELVHVESVMIGGQAVLLPRAIPGVPEYIAAARAEAEADKLLPQLGTHLDSRGAMPYQPNTEAVFDFEATAGTAVVAAIWGLEAFANHRISASFGQDDTVELDGESYTRDQLWNMPLSKRLADILPPLTRARSPKQERWWATMRRVQGLAALSRHGITAPYEKNGLAGKKSLIQRYCAGEYRGAAAMMLAVFDHFVLSWLDPEARAHLPPPPNP